MAADVDTAPHTIRLDLNFDDVPDKHKGKYQLVTNFGTTEHVANQNQAMKIIHDLTAVGGVMVHNLPMQRSCRRSTRLRPISSPRSPPVRATGRFLAATAAG
jgi:hypothetical protein